MSGSTHIPPPLSQTFHREITHDLHCLYRVQASFCGHPSSSMLLPVHMPTSHSYPYQASLVDWHSPKLHDVPVYSPNPLLFARRVRLSALGHSSLAMMHAIMRMSCP